jgi:predicted CoA-binding protein
MTGTDDFLAQNRLAVVGVSHAPKDFTRVVFRALRDRDYDVVPVNPKATEIEGKPCYPSVQDVQPAVAAALVMTKPEMSEQVVKDCAAAGIRRVWLLRRSPAAVAFCDANGISVIAGECPLMYLRDMGWIHRFHGWLKGHRGERLVNVT